ncbi:ArsR/SmtB family transcription factor [Paenibacillus caseinilyticus]|uniref:ArsR family transcriptional regulator n=1 Tax=Paenibacillus mucilaginosus K02 TaxID=997761 RepID=I0BN49_9BACL|nr:ArsR family transcriptional regulator [Paenibacillus mucilaginosus]AFH63796.1 ArsR family transcriptional regulator [Paenibacillus mucilaginosus K02]
MEKIVSESNLPLFEALASNVRIKIIELLGQQPMIMKDLASALGLSNSIITMHVKKLERADLVRTEMIPGKGASQKLCTLVAERIELVFPSKGLIPRNFHVSNIPIGHFTDFEVKPTCGLASKYKIIGGGFDDPRYFLDTERVDAKILWFSQGYVTYKIANYLLPDEEPEELEISMELASEAPLSNEHWPSDISFAFNGVDIGKWTSPGDFGGTRGKHTPEWWDINMNQYGLLVHIRINEDGTFIEGTKVSDYTIRDIHIRKLQWDFTLSVKEDAKNLGGLTIYGTGFGNYYQDIVFKLTYISGAAKSFSTRPEALELS